MFDREYSGNISGGLHLAFLEAAEDKADHEGYRQGDWECNEAVQHEYQRLREEKDASDDEDYQRYAYK